MRCETCGRPLPAGLLCGCGAVGPALVSKTSGMAIAGFVTAFFCGLIGLILSIVALGDIKRSNGQVTGEGLAIGGIVVASLSMLLGLAMALNK